MKKVYICGKITGMEAEAIMLFAEAESFLKLGGYEPVNPFKLNHEHDKSWESYMRVCIKALCECDAIYLLNNYNKSSGAQLELMIAKKLNITRLFQPIFC